MAETGHVINVGNLQKAIVFATGWAGNYKPSNAALEIGAMSALAVAAEAELDSVQTQRTPYRNATAAAADAFAGLRNLTVRIQKSAKSQGCPASFIEDLDTPARKIKGLRATPAVQDDPNTPVDESKQSVSASQMSRQQRIEHLDEMRSLLESQPLYKPNETELQTASLQALAVDLQAKVDAVTSTFAPFSNALASRDNVLYTNAANVYKTGTLFKAYVESKFTRKSNEWNQIKGLEFRDLKRTP